MTTMYSVVRYLPDTVTGEFVNVGVLAWGDGTVRSRFVDRWTRTETIPGHASLVRHFVARFAPGAERQVTEAEVEEMVNDWSGCIQFAPARPSMDAPEDALATMAGVFLRVPSEVVPAWHSEYRNRSDFLTKNALPVLRG